MEICLDCVQSCAPIRVLVVSQNLSIEGQSLLYDGQATDEDSCFGQ